MAPDFFTAFTAATFAPSYIGGVSLCILNVIAGLLVSLCVVLFAEILLSILRIATVALLWPVSVLLLSIWVVLLELLARLERTSTRLKGGGAGPKCVDLVVYVEVL